MEPTLPTAPPNCPGTIATYEQQVGCCGARAINRYKIVCSMTLTNYCNAEVVGNRGYSAGGGSGASCLNPYFASAIAGLNINC